MTVALAVRGDLAWTEVPGYVVAQFLGAVTGVVAAHGMFDLPLIAVHQGTRRTQSWLERVCRKLWALIFDFDWLTPSSGISPLRGCRVHHGGLLVYRLHLFCESRCNLCAHVDRHLLGVSARWTSRYSCSASLWLRSLQFCCCADSGKRDDRTPYRADLGCEA